MSMRYWKVTLGVYSPTFIGSGTIYKKDSYIYDREHNQVYFWMKESGLYFSGSMASSMTSHRRSPVNLRVSTCSSI